MRDSIQRHETIDAALEPIERVRYLSLLRPFHILDEVRESRREDLVSAGERHLTVLRQLQQLLAPVRRGSLAQYEPPIHKTIEHSLHRCRTNTRMPGDLRGDLLAVVKALQDPQLPDGQAAARAHEFALHQA